VTSCATVLRSAIMVPFALSGLRPGFPSIPLGIVAPSKEGCVPSTLGEAVHPVRMTPNSSPLFIGVMDQGASGVSTVVAVLEVDVLDEDGSWKRMSWDSVKGPGGLTLPVVVTCEKRASAVFLLSCDVTAKPI
jgi:hypothetical protein